MDWNLNNCAPHIEMCDLRSEYESNKQETDNAIQRVLDSCHFIKGPEVKTLESELAEYVGVKHCITCGNGTDALLLALMSLNLAPGTEVITPSFTFVSTAEVIVRLGLVPVFVDVDLKDFIITPESVEKALSSKTGAIIIVHLFGLMSRVTEKIADIARSHNIPLIEDAAQSFGAKYYDEDGNEKRSCSVGKIGCTSFFPTKNLGCYGDGGAVFTDDDEIADYIRPVANHGMAEKYTYINIGVNSRLDAIQAAVLRVKLSKLDNTLERRRLIGYNYNQVFKDIPEIGNVIKYTPYSHYEKYHKHTYNQYTVIVRPDQYGNSRRDELRKFLQEKGVPTMVYYPNPIHTQKAYTENDIRCADGLENTINLCKNVLSLPMHPYLTVEQQFYIARCIKEFGER